MPGYGRPAQGAQPGYAPQPAGYGSTGYASVPTPDQGEGAASRYRRLAKESPLRTGLVGAAALGLVVLLMVQFLGNDSPQSTASQTGNANQTTPAEQTVDRSRIRASASSTQEPEKNGVTYSLDNTLDGNTTTAWNSNGRADGPGKGIVLTYTFDSPVNLTRITLHNGYQRVRTRKNGTTMDLYKLNKRVRQFKVVTDSGTWNWDVKDTRQPQEFIQDFGTASWVRLEVVETYKSDQYKDLAVSEVAFTAGG